MPVFYLPVIYYPTKEEDRATGFLLPTYGASTLRGQTIHVPSSGPSTAARTRRSLRLVFEVRPGMGSEYRYNLGAVDGDLRSHARSEESTYLQADGSSTHWTARGATTFVAAPTSCSRPSRARGRVDYFSSVVTLTAVQHEHLRRVAEPAELRRQPGRLPGAAIR